MTGVVLLLAGTREARDLAERWSMPDVRLIASLAGATTDPLAYSCEIRTGGFGGVDGLAEWLAVNGVTAIIDATHPFATQMTANAVEACMRTGTPRLCFRRAPWPLENGWTEFETYTDLSQALPGSARVFLTTGHAGLKEFSARKDIWFLARSIEPLGPMPDHIEPLLARPPFTLAGDNALMRENRITHLVTKNAGGLRPAKLDAAEAQGVKVWSVEMPPAPAGDVVSTAEEALSWVAQWPMP